MHWTGDYLFLLKNLILKDFRIRYRNMSLGVFWSLLNPLVMMVVYTFVFSNIFRNSIPHFPQFILTGIILFGFFQGAWATGTTSMIDNAGLVKRVSVPREVIPITSVLATCIHVGIQLALLLAFVLFAGVGINANWLWLPVIWGLLIVALCGLALLTSSLQVYVRDTRYVVDSFNTVLFWLVPIIYDESFVPVEYQAIYAANPLAAAVIATRQVLLQGRAPAFDLMWKLALASALLLGLGSLLFRRLQARFYDYL